MSTSYSSATAHVLLQRQYDVFLSFRGTDTRHGFTKDLYNALKQKNIDTYIDDRLEAGDVVADSLVAAIEHSKISIVVLSENYATSVWCLDELVHIFKCRQMYGQIVLPVFYKVDPSVVRYQVQSYADAFVKHEKRFKEDMEKVLIWKDALSNVAALSGYDSQNQNYRPDESVLVDAIVRHTWKKLKEISSTISRGFHGMESRVHKIEMLLNFQAQDVRSIGIWGMGGAGKTTLADEVFRRHSSEFDSCLFLGQVREESDMYGIQHLREKLEESLGFDSEMPPKKVLVVLDDVSSSSQIEGVLGDEVKFALGSRIIITSRDKLVLSDRVDADHMHSIKELETGDALRVIYSKASKHDLSETEFLDLSRRAADISNGLPLVVKILSSELGCCKTRSDWEDVLNRWENVPNEKVKDVLRPSYNGLQEDEKAIFLDIACFFKGIKRGKAEKMLQIHRPSAPRGVEVLISKSLVSISEDGNLEMHDLLQEMGRSIVREECTNNSLRRSRLWKPKDVYQVLKNQQGTTQLEAISTDISKIPRLQLSPKAFKNMHNLWLLRLYTQQPNVLPKMHIPEGLDFLPDNLRYLYWEQYPSRSLPSGFSLRNLVELQLPNSTIEKLWNDDDDKNLPNMKRLNLRGCKHLTGALDFSRSPNIERLILSECTGLLELHVNKLENLSTLKISGCSSLKVYPKMPCNVRYLDLSHNKLTGVPDLSQCPNLETLYLDHCDKLIRLPNGCLKHHTKLTTLNMASCSRLTTSPEIPCSLKVLDLSSCSRLTKVPDLSKCLNLEEIDLCDCTCLVRLPNAIFKNLDKVSRLLLAKCSNLEVCPELPRNIRELDLSECPQLTKVPHLSKCLDIENIDFCDCTGLVQLPDSIFKNLDKVKRLLLANCTSLEVCPELPRNLQKLDLSSCSQLTEVPDLSKCFKLEKIDLCCCTRLVRIPYIKNLDKLSKLLLGECSNLEAFPAIPQNVRKLFAPSCFQVTQFPDISKCAKIERIDLSDCTSLAEVPDYVRHLDFSRSADVMIKLHGCTSIKPPVPQVIRKSVDKLVHTSSDSRLGREICKPLIDHSSRHERLQKILVLVAFLAILLLICFCVVIKNLGLSLNHLYRCL